MARFLLTVTVLLVLVAAAFALKCYECSGTEDTCSRSTLEGDSSFQKTCSSLETKCIRTWLHKDGNTVVGNSCTNDLGCSVAETFCDNVEGGVDCEYGCCDTDLCNAGSPVSFSTFLMAVCAALGLALLM